MQPGWDPPLDTNHDRAPRQGGEIRQGVPSALAWPNRTRRGPRHAHAPGDDDSRRKRRRRPAARAHADQAIASAGISIRSLLVLPGELLGERGFRNEDLMLIASPSCDLSRESHLGRSWGLVWASERQRAGASRVAFGGVRRSCQARLWLGPSFRRYRP